MKKKRIVVVCPGRGSYTKETLGYLKGRKSIAADLELIDTLRAEGGDPTISELDSMEKFKVSMHTKGEHASPLIYACSKADFSEINREENEIVAITGNSMGWYLTLAFAGALDPRDSFQLIQTMGAMMRDKLIGGQIIYPIIDENWQVDEALKAQVFQILKEIQNSSSQNIGPGKSPGSNSDEQGALAYVSIFLGGYLVLAGNKAGLDYLTKNLPPKENYPFQLVNHGAFHTPLMGEISERGFKALDQLSWRKPSIPMIDGRGKVWSQWSTDTEALRDYTLGHQVTDPYDFTTAISVALKEFAPDEMVLLGPGNSLGGSIGQIMVANRWLEIDSKERFKEVQKDHMRLRSLGL